MIWSRARRVADGDEHRVATSGSWTRCLALGVPMVWPAAIG